MRMRAIHLIPVFLLEIFLCSCPTPPQDCSGMNEKKFAIRDTAGHWFDDIPASRTLHASSSQGNTQNYSLTPSSRYMSWGQENCNTLKGEQRILRYSSASATFLFYLSITQDEGRDYFRITQYDYAYSEGSRYEAVFPLSKNTFTSYPDYYSEARELPLLKLDSLVVGGKTFMNVYKMDLLQTENAFDRKVRTYYFNSASGLLRFETFDGEVWDLF